MPFMLPAVCAAALAGRGQKTDRGHVQPIAATVIGVTGKGKGPDEFPLIQAFPVLFAMIASFGFFKSEEPT